VTEQADPSRRRLGIGPVIWGSVALFAALFALLTYQLSAAQAPAPRPVLVRKVVKRRVVATIVPTPGRSGVTTSDRVAAAAPPTEYAPVTTAAS
jgi:hypothetical protein